MGKTNIPEIRFRGFDRAWEEKFPNSLFKTYNDRNHPELHVLSATQDKGMVVRESINYDVQHDKKNEITYKRVLPKQFVIHLRSFQGGFAHSEIEGICSPAYTIFGFTDNENHDIFWKYIFSSNAFIQRLPLITYGIRDGRSIKYEDFCELGFYTPSFAEQARIASLFTTLDKQISISESKLDKLRAIKKTLLKKMFADQDELTPQIRFKGFDGAWEENKLNSYLEVSTEKNSLNLYGIYDVLSVSGEVGVVNQIEFQGRSFAGSSVSNYGVLRTGEVTYTKSPLKSCPYGIIKANKGDTGIVSVLYGVYKSKGVNTDFVQDYFDLISRLNNYLRPLVNKGAKNTLLISDDDALEGTVKFPKSNTEQTRIAFLFTSLDKQISLQEKKIEKLKAIKKTLLKKMFV